MTKRKVCKVRGCKNAVHSRGVCATHYGAFHRLVIQKKSTWSELEEAGLVDRPRNAAALLAQAKAEKLN